MLVSLLIQIGRLVIETGMLVSLLIEIGRLVI